MMIFLQRLNFRLRRLIWQAYHAIAPLMCKIKINKIRIGRCPLGHIIYPLMIKILHYQLPQLIEVKGMLMYHQPSDGRMQFGWLYAFGYEPETQHIFEEIVKPGMTVVDVGAHIGYYTLMAAKLIGPKGKVYAFEPDPAYYALLEKNIRINRLKNIVESFKLAVSNTEKRALFFLENGTVSSLFKGPDSMGQTVFVGTVSLDNFFAQQKWPPVHLVKIDAEGSDKFVLEGMRRLAQRNRDLKIIIEINPKFLKSAGVAAEDILILLNEMGFCQICLLSGETKFYRLPQDIQFLARFAQEHLFVNLFCETDL